MRVHFCGVRGSMPAAGPEFVRYGGHTSCVAVAHDGADEPSLVLDAGTGLRRLTALLGDRPYRGSVLVSHLHWDHVHGMPFFRAGARDGARVEVLLPAQDGDAEQVLERMMSPPTFPITPGQLGPGWRFEALEAGVRGVEGFTVTALDIPHKGGRTLGFRVADGHSALAYLSDHDPRVLGPGRSGLGELHEAAVALARDVDLLVHDAQITAAEVATMGYLGHAAAEYAFELAEEAGAHRVAMFHHGVERSDDALDALAEQWSAGPVPVLVTREGLAVDLPWAGHDQVARGPEGPWPGEVPHIRVAGQA